MKIEVLRSRGYRGDTLEAGRVYSVDANFAGWMLARGFAKPYVEPVEAPKVDSESPQAEPAPDQKQVKRGRAAR